jgi:hypothetical protein
MIVLLSIAVLQLSCVSQNGNNRVSTDQFREAPVTAVAEEMSDPAVEEFDPKNPPIEIYTETMRDIQRFVENVDNLIKAKNYSEWEKLLSRDYLELITSKVFLDEVSQQPRLKSQNIVLRTGRDYFLNVVVMSRANLRANDIEFITLTRVMAFTINQTGQRIRIYTLDRIKNGWEIVS